mgnify:CR=1 FL=1
MFLGKNEGRRLKRGLLALTMSLCGTSFLGGGCAFAPWTQANYYAAIEATADGAATAAVQAVAGLVGLDTIPVVGDAVIAGADQALETAIVNVHRPVVPSYDAQE